MPTLRETAPLRYRKVFKKSLSRISWTGIIGMVLSLVFFGIIYLISEANIPSISPVVKSYHQELGFIWLTIFIVLIGWSPVYELLYLLTYFYDADDKYVYIRKGVFIKREITLPFSKITDVYVDQDVLDFILCIYDVHISTPTIESGLFAHIDGLDKRGAALLKALLVDKVHQDQTVR